MRVDVLLFLFIIGLILFGVISHANAGTQLSIRERQQLCKISGEEYTDGGYCIVKFGQTEKRYVYVFCYPFVASNDKIFCITNNDPLHAESFDDVYYLGQIKQE